MIIFYFFSAGAFCSFFCSSLPFSPSGAFSPPSLAADSPVVPSAPSTPSAAPSSPSAATSSAGFSGSLKTVGAATVAITNPYLELSALHSQTKI